MRKEYFDTPKEIRSEPAAGGKKRIWIEVAEGEAKMIKMDGNAKQADIDAAAEKLLADLKDTQQKKKKNLKPSGNR